MFLLNLGYRWNLASSVDEITGALFLPSGNSIEKLSRAALPEYQRLLFDPQLYLATLDADKCGSTCARLCTYPWFMAEIDSFDSQESTRRDWEKSLKDNICSHWRGTIPSDDERDDAAYQAVNFQVNRSCTHIILPTPLISEREDEAALTGEWIDSGLSACGSLEIGQEVLATVAVSEGALNDQAFNSGGLLETIVDQVTAREGIDGVYLVIAQTAAKQHPYACDSRVLRAYLNLTRAFRQAGFQVVVNFAGVFGKVCMGVGATGFAVGASQGQRRMSLADFEESGGGPALPRYYSDLAIGEFLTETDLNVIVENRLLRRIRDVTSYSQPLIEVLESGGTAADLPEWAEGKNNVAQAQRHLVARLALEAAAVQRRSPRQRIADIRDWLDEGQAVALLIQRRIGDEIDPVFAPTERWLNVFNAEVT